jgi:hypothetical protein
MRKIFIFAVLLALSAVSHSQGCSDAGFCSIGNLSHQSASDQPSTSHYFKIMLPAGVGDDDVFVFAPGIEYGYQNRQWQFSGKVTGNYASGNLGSAAGAGDLFLSATYQLPAKNSKWVSSFTLGAKFPLSGGDLKEDGLSLPMQYQSSLGTVDIIAGIAVTRDRWKLAAGWQQPLTGRNQNNFLRQYWRNGEANAYPPTNDFDRKGDVLLRTSYRFLDQARWALEGGLLGIYHLGKDTYIDGSVSNRPIPLDGSEGLTLNATASLEVELNKRLSLALVGGVPLVVRDVRPDGLTRSFVLMPQLTFNF